VDKLNEGCAATRSGSRADRDRKIAEIRKGKST
jgi:hypothetical protein